MKNDFRVRLLQSFADKGALRTILFACNMLVDDTVDMRHLMRSLGIANKINIARVYAYAEKVGVAPNVFVSKRVGRQLFVYADFDVAFKVVGYFACLNLVQGHGINDVEFSIKVNGRMIPSYVKWKSMLQRCYCPDYQKRKPTYAGCVVSSDWLLFSNFYRWFNEHYREGYALDKDLLNKGAKVYSEENCVFIPQRINNLLVSSFTHRGDLPQGVSFRKDRDARNKAPYAASFTIDNARKHVGYFNSAEQAFFAYKKAKEAYIRKVAHEYFVRGAIDKRVFDALCAYRVVISD